MYQNTPQLLILFHFFSTILSPKDGSPSFLPFSSFRNYIFQKLSTQITLCLCPFPEGVLVVSALVYKDTFSAFSFLQQTLTFWQWSWSNLRTLLAQLFSLSWSLSTDYPCSPQRLLGAVWRTPRSFLFCLFSHGQFEGGALSSSYVESVVFVWPHFLLV